LIIGRLAPGTTRVHGQAAPSLAEFQQITGHQV